MTKGRPGETKGGWLRSIEIPKGKVVRIQNGTFDRMKQNSSRNGEVESVSEIIDRLLDNWDQYHQR